MIVLLQCTRTQAFFFINLFFSFKWQILTLQRCHHNQNFGVYWQTAVHYLLEVEPHLFKLSFFFQLDLEVKL